MLWPIAVYRRRGYDAETGANDPNSCSGLTESADMAAPWSTIITGAVRVAGIGGTLLSARWQTAGVKLGIAAQSERARVADRRKVYAAASAALNDGLMVISDQELAGQHGGVPDSVLVAANSAAWELQLIASVDVSRLARDALTALQIGDGDTLLESLAALIPAMRADLGNDPLDIADLW
jgi:hypothetical protein